MQPYGRCARRPVARSPGQAVVGRTPLAVGAGPRASAAIRCTTAPRRRPAAGCGCAWCRARSRSACSASTVSSVGTELGRAPAGALLGTGGQEDLHSRFGGDDRADVASLGDPVAGLDQRALLGHERLAHAGVAPPRARRPRDRGRADLSLTSWPSSVRGASSVSPPPPTLSANSIRAARASSAGSRPGSRSESSATQRYIAPLSR